MSGASGSFPALIHAVSKSDNLYKIHTDDELMLDLKNAVFSVMNVNLADRESISIHADNSGLGRSLFKLFRNNVSSVNTGASIFND
jgi:phosphogluconate dehydratase